MDLHLEDVGLGVGSHGDAGDADDEGGEGVEGGFVGEWFVDCYTFRFRAMC